MSKFSETIEKRIRFKADRAQEEFYKEFENLLYKYGITRNVIFYGLQNEYKKSEDKGQEWSDRVKDVFIQKETEKFIQEISRIEHYFN